MLRHVPVGLVVLDDDGAPVYCNEAASRLLRDSASPVDAIDLDRVRDGHVVHVEVDMPGPGTGTAVEAWASRVEGADGARTAVVLADATERRRTEQRLSDVHADLVRKAAALQRSNAELETFAYVASHDLAEPLRVISGYVELLARRYTGRLDAEADEFIGFAVDGCTRMRRLIDDLLEYSRVAWSDPELGPVDTSVVVDIALNRLRTQIDETGADVALGALPIVIGDPERLVALFQNLIGNSLKFRHPDHPPRVDVAARRQDDADWLFTVRDNGIGIEAAFRERAFGMFRRLHPRDSYPGTGIGLALCRTIVERHGGRIWIDDAVTAGTRVCFTLPPWEGGGR